jgi:hypothetical protein
MISLKRAGGVAQGVGPEFKPQYWKGRKEGKKEKVEKGRKEGRKSNITHCELGNSWYLPGPGCRQL